MVALENVHLPTTWQESELMFCNNGLLHHNVIIAAGPQFQAQCWQITLVLYIHTFCDFWADQAHMLWLNTQLPAQRISQPAPGPQQVQPALTPLAKQCGYPHLPCNPYRL